MKDCMKCDLGRSLYAPVNGRGPMPADIMVVGGFPTPYEVENEGIFNDYSGNKLKYQLREAGLDSSNIYFTNIIKCVLPNNVKTPLKCHIDKCKIYFDREIEKVKPKYIISVGNTALQFFKGTQGITDFRGYWFGSDYGIPVMPIFDKSACLHKWENDEIVIYDLKKVVNSLRTGIIPSYNNFGKYVVVDTIKKLDKYINIALTKKRLAFDTETTGLKFWVNKILCVSFSWKKHFGVTVPLLGQYRSRIWTSNEKIHIIDGLKTLLESPLKKVTHNGKFDVNFLRYNLGIRPSNMWFDTLLAHHLINENIPHNLTFLCDWYGLDVGRYEDVLIEYVGKSKKSKDYSLIPNNILHKYAAVDVDVPLRLYKTMKEQLREQKLYKLFREKTMPSSDVVADMEYEGIPLNIDGMEKLANSYKRKEALLKWNIRKIVKNVEFNPNSPIQVRDYLFSALKIEPIKKTKGNAYSTDEEVLNILVREGYEVPKFILELRKLQKFRSTYLEGFVVFADKYGKVHATYLIFGTRTGRLSCTNPNLQNIPRDPKIRQLLFYSPEGYVFVGADYKQIEARLIALFSCDAAYLEVCHSSDIHTEIASIAYSKDSADITEEERAKAKSITFGLSYGRSAESISDEFGIPVDEVVEFMDNFYKRFYRMAAWRKRQPKIVKSQGYLRTIFGRRRRFDSYIRWLRSPENKESLQDSSSNYYLSRRAEGDFERQAINFKIQSSAGDYLTISKIATYNTFIQKKMKAQIVLDVHDMFMCICPVSEVADVRTIMDREMRKTVTFRGHSVDLIPDFFEGRRWEK